MINIRPYEAKDREFVEDICAGHADPLRETLLTCFCNYYFAKEYLAHLHIDIAGDYQRQGIGTKLIDALIEHLRKKSVKGLMFSVAIDNEKGLGFYRKYGFKELGCDEREIFMGLKMDRNIIKFENNELQEYEKTHIEKVRKSAAECAVLLKKDGTLPWRDEKSIALLGNGVRHTIKGGTGSGDVNVRSFANIEESFEKAGYQVTSKKWLDEYDIVLEKAQKEFKERLINEAKIAGIEENFYMMGKEMPEPEYEMLIEVSAKTAVYVLSRNSGEGADRKAVEGDINLTKTEIRDILYANNKYDKFVLVLNVGGMVNLKPVWEVKNILLLGQLGTPTGDVLTDLLSGKSYPSGKLAMTWTDIDEYPSTKGFGNPDDTYYNEGIFVGYRYFDSITHKPFIPFGYGLSYTDFEIKVTELQTDSDIVDVKVLVKNVGDSIGKEVVQAYGSAPKGRMEKPYQQLVSFVKTKELKPKETQELIIKFDKTDLASFDEIINKFVLEKGNYTIRIGSHSGKTFACGSFKLDGDCIVAQSFDRKQPDTSQELRELVSRLNIEEMAGLCVGAGAEAKGGVHEIIGNASKLVPGAAGETTHILEDKGVGTIVMSDGPAGIRINKEYEQDGKKYYQFCTAIPIGTDLAQSFNMQMCEELGNLVGSEMEMFGINLWLAPALNIQRSPLCGRNFEYYSEDPLVSGKVAAAITRGVQSHKGCGTTIKHFACNNQETNRYASNSVVSERALREIYLKGFEICIKESQPKAVMSSYNLINGEHTCNQRRLLTDILRDEWGYEGIVMTDWFATQSFLTDKHGKYKAGFASGCIQAGNDIIMPGSPWDREEILKALDNPDCEYPITKANLEECVLRILRCIADFGEMF